MGGSQQEESKGKKREEGVREKERYDRKGAVQWSMVGREGGKREQEHIDAWRLGVCDRKKKLMNEQNRKPWEDSRAEEIESPIED